MYGLTIVSGAIAAALILTVLYVSTNGIAETAAAIVGK
jgi:hypothetical protein